MMPNAADKMRELQDGVTELTLPNEALELVSDLRKAIKVTTPTEERDGEAVIYSYDVDCKAFSYAIASQKAQDIKDILSEAKLKPTDGIRKPGIFGLDRGGFYTQSGFIGVSVLISDSAKATISSPGKSVSHTWSSGLITLFMGNTTLMLRNVKGDDRGEGTEDGSLKSHGKRVIYFYFMIPVVG